MQTAFHQRFPGVQHHRQGIVHKTSVLRQVGVGIGKIAGAVHHALNTSVGTVMRSPVLNAVQPLNKPIYNAAHYLGRKLGINTNKIKLKHVGEAALAVGAGLAGRAAYGAARVAGSGIARAAASGVGHAFMHHITTAWASEAAQSGVHALSKLKSISRSRLSTHNHSHLR